MTTEPTDSTRANLRVGLRDFLSWCAAEGIEPLAATPEQASRFLHAVAARRAAVAPEPSPKALYNYAAPRKRAVDRLFEGAGRQSPFEIGEARERWEALSDASVGIMMLLADAPPQPLPSRPSPLLERLEPKQKQNESNRAVMDRLLLRLLFYGQLSPGEIVGLSDGDVRVDKGEVAVDVRLGQNPRTVRITGEPARLVRESLAAWRDRLQATADEPLLRPISRADRIQPGGLNSRTVGRVIQRYGEARGIERSRLTWRALVDSALQPGSRGLLTVIILWLAALAAMITVDECRERLNREAGFDRYTAEQAERVRDVLYQLVQVALSGTDITSNPSTSNPQIDA